MSRFIMLFIMIAMAATLFIFLRLSGPNAGSGPESNNPEPALRKIEEEELQRVKREALEEYDRQSKVELLVNGAVLSPTLMLQLQNSKRAVSQFVNKIGYLKSAEIALKGPERMDYGTTEDVELALSPEGVSDAPSSFLDPNIQGTIKEFADVEYSLITTATLESTDFEVMSIGPSTRTILENRPTVWSWRITPLRYGEDLDLSISLFAKIDETLPEVYIKTFRSVIRVDVNALDKAKLFVQDLSWAEKLIAGAGSGLTAVVAFLWNRRRRSSDIVRHTRDP